jgi:hypothetical protein
MAKSVTFKKVSTPTYNNRGEIISSTYTESTVTIVDYSINKSSKSREQWGEFLAGDRVAAIPYNVDVGVDDIFVIRSEDYRVVDVRTPELPDVVVVLAQLRKVES